MAYDKSRPVFRLAPADLSPTAVVVDGARRPISNRSLANRPCLSARHKRRAVLDA